MSTIKYLFGDLGSRTIIAELPLTSVSMDRKLNDWGILRCIVKLDASGIDNADIIAATVPFATFVVVERDSTVIWEGIVWTRTYDSQAKNLQITARTYEGFAEKQVIDTDLDYVEVEQRNIMLDLWNTMQSVPERNLGIVVPSSFASVLTRTLSVKSTEYKNFFQVMSAMADGADGFDWTIEVQRSGTQYIRTLRIGYPVLGAMDVAGLSWDYPGNITNYWKTDGGGSTGTHIHVLGAGEGTSMPVGTYVHSDLIANGHKRYDLVIPRKDVDNAGVIQSLANQLGPQRRPPLVTIKVMVRANVEPVFGSYGLGDLATVAIVDARHPNGFTSSARIVAYSYRPQSDDTVEMAELVFEGDELNE